MFNNIEECYKILDISNLSNNDDIKKKYRQLSLKYHPDKNNNKTQELFKKITNAYEYIINNNNSNSNSNNNNNNNNNNNTNCEIILNNKDLNNNLTCNLHNYDKYNIDIFKTLDITYEQAYYGCSVPINIVRTIINNNFINEEKETLYVNIAQGIDNNEIIILENKGNIINNIKTHIKISIKLLPHLLFNRNGLDIIFKINLSFKESLIGFEYILKHINNKKYKIKNKEGEIITNTSKMLLRNLGFYRNNYYGNLIIIFDINYKKLEKTTIEKLKNIL